MCREQDVVSCCQTGAEVDATAKHAVKRQLELEPSNKKDTIALGAIGRLLQDFVAEGHKLPSTADSQGDVMQLPENPSAEAMASERCDPESLFEDEFDDFALPPPAIALDFSDDTVDDSEDEFEAKGVPDCERGRLIFFSRAFTSNLYSGKTDCGRVLLRDCSSNSCCPGWPR